jgi:undecaprenyl-diphosphatase
MIFGSDYLIYIIFVVIFYLSLKGSIKEKKALILILFALPIAVLIIKIIHIFIIEPRPFVTYNFTPLTDPTANASFPSRHTTIISLIAFSYAFYKSKFTSFMLFFLAWIGLSRIYIGVHYPVDILGGAGVGLISLFIARKFLKLIRIRFFS